MAGDGGRTGRREGPGRERRVTDDFLHEREMGLGHVVRDADQWVLLVPVEDALEVVPVELVVVAAKGAEAVAGLGDLGHNET
jgi:hypothetical protein